MPLLGGNSALGFRATGGATSAGAGFIGIALQVPDAPLLAVPGAVSLVVVNDTIGGTMTSVSVNKQPDEFDIRVNNRLPNYLLDVYKEDGTPLDLSAATAVVFTMVAKDSTKKIDAVAGAVIVGLDEVTQNRLSYAWAAIDTDTAGRYTAEFELTFPTALPRTFPASNKIKLVINIGDDH